MDSGGSLPLLIEGVKRKETLGRRCLRVNSNDNVTESAWFFQMIMLPWQGVSVATGSSMYYVRAVRKIACSLVSMVRRNSRGLIMR